MVIMSKIIFAAIIAAVTINGYLADIEIDRCTTIVVGPKAGTQGPMNTHTSDCSDCDFRINKVPPSDWPAGSFRKVYMYKGNYPSVVSENRGKTWHPSNLEGSKEQLKAWGLESVIVNKIPQMPHTYGLFEAGYAIMNEHQVAIGESTCAAKFWGKPVTAGGLARIEVSEMSKIALERTTTAREAIQLMGDLAVEYGYYAADWSGGDASKGEGGEGLTVIDKTEAWVFHVLADDTGASAVWVAQRLLPDHVAVIANQFVIQEVEPNSENFLYSSNLWEVAIRNKLWDPSSGTLLNFAKTYAPVRAHSPYATRRVWRVFNMVAPSVALPPNTDPYGSDYPFSIKADKPLTPEDIMKIQRDHYEGTQYDLTKGLQAGPYGDPNRWDMTPVENYTRNDMIQGSFERSISLFRTSYSFVAVARAHVPDVLALLWFSQYAPSSASYVPFYVATKEVPPPFARGSLYKYDPTIAFWNFLAAGNYAGRFYKYAMEDVRELQSTLFNRSATLVEQFESRILSAMKSKLPIGTIASEMMATFQESNPTLTSTLTDSSLLSVNNVDHSIFLAIDSSKDKEPLEGSTSLADMLSNLLTLVTMAQSYQVTDAWKDLLPQLITKYHDGYIAEDLDAPNIRMKKIFYPKWWLDAVGYFNSKPNSGPDVILFAPSPISTLTTSSYSFTSLLIVTILSSGLTFFITWWIIQRNSKIRKFNNLEYHQIDI